jgi:hypothetical protein
MRTRQAARRAGLLILVPSLFLVLSVALPARAQIEANLSAYTGPNAEGYLNPLKDAVGAALNSGAFRTANIPLNSFHLNVEVKTMVVKFGSSDKTFTAHTEAGFMPAQDAVAPTVIGSTQAVVVPGQSGTATVFPGGLDVKSVGLAVPQITVGNVYGTQALARYVAFNTGDTEIGDLKLWGVGLRHSISQYLHEPPVDLAVGALYQKFKLGNKLIDSDALTIGVQASRQFSVVEPYVGLGYDSFKMKVKYESKATQPPTSLDVDFGNKSSVHFTGGVGLNLWMAHLYGEVNLSSQTSFLLGLSLGN